MVEPVTPRFGQLLRRLRLAAGLSQDELAERAGVSSRGVRALEAGHRASPRPETIRLLAEALDLDEMTRTELIAAARPELTDPATPAGAAAGRPP
jgi:transcriptional regulator with XRE-family HTH domain